MTEARKLTELEIVKFRRVIWDFYRESHRVFPWRETNDPYAIMVSEFMLQQTQTERVVPKYLSWLQNFPDPQSVASASVSEIYTAWNGLGYNRRALFLKRACTILSASGQFPHNVEEYEKLPGIGPYTARAICAFAFNRPEIVIETNIRSVYLFLFFKEVPGKIPDADIIPLIEQTIEKEKPRDWYYALMDYGAELKKTITNPNRKSSGYTKQSKFEGSFRQARGAIIRQLTSINNQVKTEKICLTSVSETEHIEIERLKEAALSLEKEGIIYLRNDFIGFLDK